MTNTQTEQVTKVLTARMVEAGVDMDNQAAVAAYLAQHADAVLALIKELEESPFERHHGLDVLVHVEFEAALTKLGMYGDNHIHAALMTFLGKGPTHKAFVMEVLHVFNRDRALYGAYFRNAIGKVSPTSSKVKNAAYATADMSRTTGDLVEAGITKTAQALNKYVFHLVARIIEAPVGGRPEEIKGFNFVNDAASRTWDKVKSKKKGLKEKGNMKETVVQTIASAVNHI